MMETVKAQENDSKCTLGEIYFQNQITISEVNFGTFPYAHFDPLQTG